MDSPLKYDESVVKEFKIGPETELDTDLKVGYVRTQLEEIKKAAYRVRVDLIIAQYQVESAEDDNVRTQHQGKVNEQKLLLKQFINSVVVLQKLVDELEPTVE